MRTRAPILKRTRYDFRSYIFERFHGRMKATSIMTFIKMEENHVSAA